MDNTYHPTKQTSGPERGILYLAGLAIVANLLFENYNSSLSNGMIALFYLTMGIVFIVLVALLILLPPGANFSRTIGILACLAMLIKMFYQATLFL